MFTRQLTTHQKLMSSQRTQLRVHEVSLSSLTFFSILLYLNEWASFGCTSYALCLLQDATKQIEEKLGSVTVR